MSAQRRYDVAGFLLAGGNRLLSASIDANQAGGVMGQRLPVRSTGPTRFIGVPGRTASCVTGAFGAASINSASALLKPEVA
jgi:hypothetical protein